MIDEGKSGAPWADYELDAIIADYFAMLDADLTGVPYVKARHSAALMAKIGRSHRSVEFKHQNVSAVLSELGLPWIPGYKPKSNYQNAIFDAIDRFLTKQPAILQFTPDLPLAGSPAGVFVDAPIPAPSNDLLPKRLSRLLNKFDPVERDHRNRVLGKAGEEFVMNVERQRLVAADRGDLARRIRWVSVEEGDGAGYDVLSYDQHGKEQLIEVKTTNGAARTPFFLSRNECEVAAERPTDWRIYRVHLFASKPQIFCVLPPLVSAVHLTPETWRASFR